MKDTVMTLDECYRVLEIAPGATENQVKEAYRDLMQIYHPDRLNSLTPRILSKAEQKTKLINEAKETILADKKSNSGEKCGSTAHAQASPPRQSKTDNDNFSGRKSTYTTAESASNKNGLRSFPLNLSPSDLIRSGNFIIFKWVALENRPEEVFWSSKEGKKNDFVSYEKGSSVIDQVTGLMWQRAGSKVELSWHDALEYVEDLNRNHFDGRNCWRLPTIDELSTLYGEYNYIEVDDWRGYYIEPFFSDYFDEEQLVCWSCDLAVRGEHSCHANILVYNVVEYIPVYIQPDSVWVYNFSDDLEIAKPHGEVAHVVKNEKWYVRAVCSLL